jgi:flagellar motor component MotA
MGDDLENAEPVSAENADETTTGKTGVIGFVLALFLLWYIASVSGMPASFLHLPSLIFVSGWAVAIGIFTFGRKEVQIGLRGILVLFGKSIPEEAHVQIAIFVLRSLRLNLYTGGALGCLIGVVQVLSNLSDPSILGVGLSLALFTLLNAIVLAEALCRPAYERLTDDWIRIVDPEEDETL